MTVSVTSGSILTENVPFLTEKKKDLVDNFGCCLFMFQ